MISNSIIYIFTLSVITTVFAYLKLNNKVPNYLPIWVIIFLFSFMLSKFGLFNIDNNMQNLLIILRKNLAPAMIFLYFLQFDFHTLFKSNGIGCACYLGAKRYWFLLTLSFFISILSQVIAIFLNFFNAEILSLFIALVFGVLLSFTKLKELNGAKDIATTMFYGIVALIGSSF